MEAEEYELNFGYMNLEVLPRHAERAFQLIYKSLKLKEISGVNIEMYTVSVTGNSMDDIVSGESGKK